MDRMNHLTAPQSPTPLENLGATCSIPTAAQLLGIGRATAYKAAADGSIPSIRIGRCVRVPSAALKRLLENGAAVANESEPK